MAMAIATAAEFSAHLDDVVRESLAAIREGLLFGLDATVNAIQPLVPVQTGNLQSSVGVPESVSSSRETIVGLDSRRDYRMSQTAAETTAVLGIGMEYAGHVAERVDFLTQPLADAIPLTQQAITQALDLVPGRVRR